MGFATTVAVRIAEKARWLTHGLFDTYRPELHYMRGPGPKWQEKHGQAAHDDQPPTTRRFQFLKSRRLTSH